MISLKDYAKSKAISYEAVRKQVNRYRAELKEHIIKKNRTQYLDEEAVAFLDKKRENNPVIVLQNDDREHIEQLEAENKKLLIKVAELQEAIIVKSDKIEQLQEANILLLEKKDEVKKTWWKFWI
jgi:hypothetical protein